MDRVVVGFAGKIASGKSSVSQAVAGRLGLPRASFGDYVRNQAKLRGLEQDRDTLQSIGAELVEKGLEQFCRAVLLEVGYTSGGGAVIDGIRHATAIDVLKQLTTPSRFFLVFVRVDELEREVRLRKRDGRDFQDRLRIDSHSTESDVEQLAARADIVIDGAVPLSELVDQVVSFITACVQNAN